MENVECMQTVKRGVFVLLMGLFEKLIAAIVKRLSSWQSALNEAAKKRLQKRASAGEV